MAGGEWRLRPDANVGCVLPVQRNLISTHERSNGDSKPAASVDKLDLVSPGPRGVYRRSREGRASIEYDSIALFRFPVNV